MTRYNPSTLGIKHGSSQNIPSSYTGIFDNILVDLDPINKKISQLENSVEELRDDVKRDIGQVKKLVAKEAESAAKKAVQDYCDKKIGSVINDAVEGKIDKLIDEERLEVEKSLNYEFDELRDFVRLSMDKELKDFKCELKEVKANTLKATADNFYKSAETLSTIAADEVFQNQLSYCNHTTAGSLCQNPLSSISLDFFLTINQFRKKSLNFFLLLK